MTEITWRRIWRRKIGYVHSLTTDELVAQIDSMRLPEGNRCAYGAMSNMFNLRFALHELSRRGLAMVSGIGGQDECIE